MRGQRLRIFFSLVVLFALAHAPGDAQDTKRALLVHTSPIYPELARRMRVSGAITLLVTIGPDGHVDEVQFESGHPLLAQAAQEAVRQWRYAQAPQRSTTSVVVSFDLPR